MATNKMLIDASHPEETRVAVVRGNRVEEFDFESQEKRQLRGNIYLAKVTRVEPSLQAAFVDYGGNRHGFLAFSEIHPDYYQIPIADRVALLEAEAEDARASRAEDDERDAASESNQENEAVEASEGDEEEAEVKKPKRARRPRRRSKAKTAEASEDSDAPQEAEGETVGAVEETPEKASGVEEVVASEEAADEKPKRSNRRPRKAKTVEVASDAAESDASDADGDEDSDPKIMSAIVEMDSISEPASEPDDESEEPSDDGEEEPVAEKPKRRTTRRKSTPKKTEEVEASADEEKTFEEAEAPAEPVAVEEETPKPKRRTTRRKPKKVEEEAVEAKSVPEAKDESEAEPVVEIEASEPVEAKSDDEPAEEPRKRRSRRSRKGTKKTEAVEVDSEENGNGDDDVESVGQEDAQEEIPPVRRRSRKQYKIQEVIKRRQVLLVQVVKEERGNKGAALTTYLSLAGRYSVLMPNTARGGGISRKITHSGDRKRLKAIANELAVPEGMGVILRTAGAARTKAEITRDFDYLMRLWEKVRNLTLSSSAPCLVYEEGSLVKRSIRDLYNKDIGEILVSGEAGYGEAKDFMEMLMPDHVDNVKLFDESQTLFSKFGVEAHLEQMVTPQVTLKSGGYLVINQTEALVAIDVNSGRSTREHSIEDTAYQTNLEAAEEVARQLRLRDLAGLIVIDFIDMEEKRNNRNVEKRMKDCLKNDRARIQVGRISHFGLMEMSRQRIRASVLESTMDVCPHCAGLGHIRSDSSISLHVFRSIEEYLAKHSRFDVLVKTTPVIALSILNQKRQALMELEERYGLKILIEGDMNIQGQEFKVEKGEPAQGKPKKQSHIDVNSGAAPESDGEHNSNDEEGGERKKRRRRRRGRGRSETNEENGSEQQEDSANEKPAEISEEPVSQEVTEANDGEEESNTKRRRRRGKRGGKRNLSADTQSNEDSEDNGSAEESAPATEDVVASEEIAEEKPKRVGRRPRKAKSEEVANDAVATDDTVTETAAPMEEVVEIDAEASDSKGRNTRRPRNQAEASTAQPVVQSSSENVEEKPKKKGGWWSRAGGFFN
ncbi:MAG: Rne/Rng family ribonuclease [Rhizobiaceae bacterium]